MSHPPANNFAIQCERARAQFLTYDQAAMCARLGLEMTEDAIPIRFLGEMCTIRRADGAVLSADGSPAPFGAVMAIYDALARDNHPVLSGKAYERIAASAIEQFIITDTIPLKNDPSIDTSKFTVVSVADLFADIIEKVYNFSPISSTFIY